MTSLNKQLQWVLNPARTISLHAQNDAKAHQLQLTKPPGSLGELELIAQRFAAWQDTKTPQLNTIIIRVFAGDHGVCAKGVSAFPQIVTSQMVSNFVAGGAAINVLSRLHNADLAVINMGTVVPVEQHANALSDDKLVHVNIAPSTKDFSEEAAMTAEQLAQALAAGKAAVDSRADVFIGGEMGIGNTASASAIYSLVLDIPASRSVGPGTGVGGAALHNKIEVVEQGVRLHRQCTSAMEVLRCVGGFEIAALVGAYIRCAQQAVPIIVDGFITTAAALLACKINPEVRAWMMFSHCSAEPAHAEALLALEAKPLLDLGLRLGEGSGAAMAVPLISSALALHSQMATFDQAGVNKES